MSMNTICSSLVFGFHKVTRMNQDYTPKISSAVVLPITWLVQPGGLLEAGFKGTVCMKSGARGVLVFTPPAREHRAGKGLGLDGLGLGLISVDNIQRIKKSKSPNRCWMSCQHTDDRRNLMRDTMKLFHLKMGSRVRQTRTVSHACICGYITVECCFIER